MRAGGGADTRSPLLPHPRAPLDCPGRACPRSSSRWMPAFALSRTASEPRPSTCTRTTGADVGSSPPWARHVRLCRPSRRRSATTRPSWTSRPSSTASTSPSGSASGRRVAARARRRPARALPGLAGRLRRWPRHSPDARRRAGRRGEDEPSGAHLMHRVATHPGTFDERLALGLTGLRKRSGWTRPPSRASRRPVDPRERLDPHGLMPAGPTPVADLPCAMTVCADGPRHRRGPERRARDLHRRPCLRRRSDRRDARRDRAGGPRRAVHDRATATSSSPSRAGSAPPSAAAMPPADSQTARRLWPPSSTAPRRDGPDDARRRRAPSAS